MYDLKISSNLYFMKITHNAVWRQFQLNSIHESPLTETIVD